MSEKIPEMENISNMRMNRMTDGEDRAKRESNIYVRKTFPKLKEDLTHQKDTSYSRQN